MQGWRFSPGQHRISLGDGSGNVQTPCEFNFPNIDDGPANKVIVKLIKLMRAAAQSYAQ